MKTMQRILTTAVILLIVFTTATGKEKTKVACVGNSITYGFGIADRENDSYPAQLQRMLGNEYLVENFGHSGTTLLAKGHRPYVEQEEFRNALNFKPDVVVIHLGINDTDPRNWPFYRDDFTRDYINIVQQFKEANPKARFFIARMTPISHRHHRFLAGTRDWHKAIQLRIERVAKAVGATLIDFYAPLLPYPTIFADGVHPDKTGARIMADVVYSAMTGNYGGLKMPAVFGSNMVVNRHRPFVIHGTANAGQKVTAELDNEKLTTVTGTDGKWRMEFPRLKVGKSYTLTVKAGRQKLVFDNIVAGEVWLCSGQSNMEFPLSSDVNGKDAISNSADNGLRFFHQMPRWHTDNIAWSKEALDSVNRLQYFDCKGWQASSPQTASPMSAVAYYFGRMLRDSLKVPVGIIMNAVGGSTTESWIDRNTLEDEYPELLNDRFGSRVMVMDWVTQRMKKNIEKSDNPLQLHPYSPTYLYDASIRGLERFPISGVIWYQGESNAQNIEIHEKLFHLLVNSWRNTWHQTDMPFLFVQLSSINRPSWTWFRDSQRRMAESIPNTAMAVSSDVGDSLDVHPRQKQPVGMRLARLALHNVYGFSNVTPCGPVAVSASEKNGEVTINYRWADRLHTSDGLNLRTVELAGEDEVFYPATATIDGQTVKAHSQQVARPAFVRYGWQPFTRANLVNGDGLPASTMRMEVR